MDPAQLKEQLDRFIAEDERRKNWTSRIKRYATMNETYMQLLGDDCTLRRDVRYFESYGGRRAAKSHEWATILGMTALREPRHFIPLIRKVAATTKDSVFAEMLSFFREEGIDVYVNKTDKEIVLPNQSRFRAFGIDDPTKMKSLVGATIIWIEESDELDEEDFDSLDAGLSPSIYPGRIVMTHNPKPQIPGFSFWYERRFQTMPHELSKAAISDDTLVLRTWYKDNAFCPPATVKVLEGYKTTNPTKYKLWALGESAQLEGAVFTNWDTVEAIPEGIIHDSIGVGLDFGFSNDPAAAVRVWVKDDEIWLKLLVYKTGLHNRMLYNELITAGVTSFEKVPADSARPDIIEDLKRMGLQGITGVKKHSGYKEEVANRLMGFKIHLIAGDTDLIREFSTYSWAQDKSGKPLPKLQDGDDHGIDCVIMMMSEYVIRKTFLWEL